MVLKNQKGITLIEMIVFIIVAAVALPVIISPVMTLLKDSTKPEKAVRANFLGQKILEVITANDFPTLTNATPKDTAPAPDIPLNPSTVRTAINTKLDDSWPSDYTKTWSIYYINPVYPDYNLEDEYTTAATDYVRIDITVTDPYGRVFNYYSIVTKRTND
ncbi:MAG: type II secretion system protein [Bacteroidales bacterium]|jgi:type II secretory pathway pseudopilin PulG|nr:type II secretion system protein [Bacteroidales bacterium]